MNYRAFVRRAFPYLVLAVGGFAVAYVVIFTFVLPSRVVPPPGTPFVPDSSGIPRPIDTTLLPPPDTAVPAMQATVPIGAGTVVPVAVPDVVGMALPDARMVLNGVQLDATVQRDTSSLQPPETVLRQSPAPQMTVPPKTRVLLVVSYFPPGADSLAAGGSAGRDTLRATGDSSADSLAGSARGNQPPPRRVRRPLPPIIPVPTPSVLTPSASDSGPARARTPGDTTVGPGYP